MKTDKYYTPTIQEIIEHVINGEDVYEFINNKKSMRLYDYHSNSSIWNLWKFLKSKGDYIVDEIAKIDETLFKIKYLDKEDIESLGWLHDKNEPNNYVKEGFDLMHHPEKNLIIIDDEEESYFIGNIKNKLELKKVLKMLNIL